MHGLETTSGVTPAHHQNVHEWAQSLAERVKALNDQLYVQSVLTVELMRYTTDHATNYYAQRRPHELAAFRWVIDGKDKARITESEEMTPARSVTPGAQRCDLCTVISV